MILYENYLQELRLFEITNFFLKHKQKLATVLYWDDGIFWWQKGWVYLWIKLFTPLINLIKMSNDILKNIHIS